MLWMEWISYWSHAWISVDKWHFNMDNWGYWVDNRGVGVNSRVRVIGTVGVGLGELEDCQPRVE